VDVDADAEPDANPEADRDVDGESGSNKVDPRTVRVGAATGAGGEGGERREEVGTGGGSMASFPLYPFLCRSSCTGTHAQKGLVGAKHFPGLVGLRRVRLRLRVSDDSRGPGPKPNY